MERQLMAYKNIKDNSYAVMMVWATGQELSDIKRNQTIAKYETIDDVRKMRDVLNGILEKWGGAE